MSILLERIQKAALQAIREELYKIGQESPEEDLAYYLSDDKFIRVAHLELEEELRVDLRIWKV